MRLLAIVLLFLLLSLGMLHAQQQPKLVLPIGHSSELKGAMFSPDEKYVLTYTWENEIKLWSSGLGKLLVSFESDSGVLMNDIAFSPNGNFVGAGSSDGARIWSINGKLLKKLPHNKGVNSVVFSNDNNFLLTASSDGSVKAWEINSGRVIRSFIGHNEPVNKIGMSIDGNSLISCSNDNTLKIWNFNTGVEIRALADGKSDLNNFYCSPDGQFILGISDDHVGIVWEISTGSITSRLVGHSQSITSAAFSKDGRTIATSSADKTIKLWNTKSGSLANSLDGHTSVVNQVIFSNDSKYILSISNDKTVKIWDAASLKLLTSRISHLDGINTICISSKGKTYLTASSDSTAKLWGMASGRLLHHLKGDAKVFVPPIFHSPSGRYLITKTKNYLKRKIDLESGKLISSESIATQYERLEDSDLIGISDDLMATIEANSLQYHRGIFVSPNRRHIIAFSHQKDDLAIGYVYEVATGKLLHRSITQSGLKNVIFSPRDPIIAINSVWSRGVKLWNYETGTLVSTLDEKKGNESKVVYNTAFSPNGDLLFTASPDAVKLWETSTWKPVFSASLDYVKQAFFSPDGKHLLLTTNSKAILINTMTRLEVGSYNAHVKSILFINDGNAIQLIQTNNVVKTMQLPSLTELTSFALTAYNESHIYSLSDKYLLGLNDYSFSIIDALNGNELLSYLAIDSIDWLVKHQSGLFDASEDAMRKLHFVQGLDAIEFSQLKERFYEPGLWRKVMNGERLRDASNVTKIELPPDIEISTINSSGIATLKLTNRDGGVGQVTISVNGLEVIEDLRSKDFNSKQPSWTFQINLATLANLKKGVENLIEVRAWNEGHWVISRPFQIRFTPPATKGAEAVVEETKKDKPQSNIHILSVGVADYEGTAIDLKYSAKDAESMALALHLGAQKLFGTEKSFVYTLTDNSKEKPNKATIKKTFAEIAKKSSPNDVFIVYLSGHGINWGGDNGDFYYLTRDAFSNDLQGYNDATIRGNVTLSSKELTELFKTVPSDKRVLIIDACASGKVVENLMTSRDISSSTLRALDRMRDRTGFHIITGCAADAVSYEASRFGQGLLTYSLIEGIKGASLRENKFVDINQLFQHARERVPVLAKGIGGIQSPQVFSPSGSQSFDIGELDEVTKAKIPLPKTRPVFIRSQLQDETKFRDVLGISKKLDEALNETSAKGENAPLLFVDVAEFPEGCQISGLYKQTGGKIIARLNKLCDGKETTISIEANTVEELISQIIAAL